MSIAQPSPDRRPVSTRPIADAARERNVRAWERLRDAALAALPTLPDDAPADDAPEPVQREIPILQGLPSMGADPYPTGGTSADIEKWVWRLVKRLKKEAGVTLTTAERFVLLLRMQAAYKTGVSELKRSTLEERTGLSRTAVAEADRKLVRIGILEAPQRRHRTNQATGEVRRLSNKYAIAGALPRGWGREATPALGSRRDPRFNRSNSKTARPRASEPGGSPAGAPVPEPDPAAEWATWLRDTAEHSPDVARSALAELAEADPAMRADARIEAVAAGIAPAEAAESAPRAHETTSTGTNPPAVRDRARRGTPRRASDVIAGLALPTTQEETPHEHLDHVSAAGR